MGMEISQPAQHRLWAGQLPAWAARRSHADAGRADRTANLLRGDVSGRRAALRARWCGDTRQYHE